MPLDLVKRHILTIGSRALPHKRGMPHSLNTVNHAVPTALSQDAQAVIFKIPESIRYARDHLHLCMESFGDAIRFGKIALYRLL